MDKAHYVHRASFLRLEQRRSEGFAFQSLSLGPFGPLQVSIEIFGIQSALAEIHSSKLSFAPRSVEASSVSAGT